MGQGVDVRHVIVTARGRLDALAEHARASTEMMGARASRPKRRAH